MKQLLVVILILFCFSVPADTKTSIGESASELAYLEEFNVNLLEATAILARYNLSSEDSTEVRDKLTVVVEEIRAMELPSVNRPFYDVVQYSALKGLNGGIAVLDESISSEERGIKFDESIMYMSICTVLLRGTAEL